MSVAGRFRTLATSAAGRDLGPGDDTPARSYTTWRFAGERAIGPAIGVTCLVVVGILASSESFLSSVLEDVLIFAIAAMGIDFLGRFGGLISLSQAGFMGAGAYGVAIFEVHGYSAWAAIGLSLAAVIALAAVTGVVAIRASGLTFVIVTLALGQLLWGIADQWTGLTAGQNGILLMATPSIGPWSLSSTTTVRVATIAVFLVVLGTLLAAVHTPFGRSRRGTRAGGPLTQALDNRTAIDRYLGFLIASLVAGVAGVLFVLAHRLVSPANLTFPQDGLLVLMVVLGGLGTIWGPCIGAAIVVLFQQEISGYVSRWEALIVVLFAAAVVFVPGGVAGLLRNVQLHVHRIVVPPASRGPAGAPLAVAAATSTAPAGTQGDLGGSLADTVLAAEGTTVALDGSPGGRWRRISRRPARPVKPTGEADR